ncbi:MAG: FAD-dependent oxidoreductase [Cyanobacteria bacterium J06656_5]
MATYSTDYDLAILGGSRGSRFAACRAAQTGARIALIAPSWRTSDAMEILLQSLQSPHIRDWAALRDWFNLQCQSAVSPTALSPHGIDVILEPARFTPELALRLENRHLKASRYLLTDGYGTSIPHGAQDSLSCHQLAQLRTLPHHIAIVGSGATAVEWAYALSRFANVTLIQNERSLLPAADRDIQRLSQAQLKSVGITLASLEDCLDSDSRQIDAKHVEADLLVAVPSHSWEALQLENVGIETPITVNRHLQTTCNQVYASGSSLGGENRPELAQQETIIALENALFGKRHTLDYGRTFYAIQLLSPIGHWGLTERQARERHGDDVQVFQAACLPAVADDGAQTNFCKLIIQGVQILGMHLMGDGAPALAAVLGHRPTIATLSQGIAAGVQTGTLYDAIHQAVEKWHHHRWSEGQWRRDWAENWFNFRRSLGN